MSSPLEALALAVAEHRAGRLAAAEPMYRQILSFQPDQPDALHFLGLLVHQTGRHEEAAGLVERAIEVLRTQPASHNTLGGVYRALQRLDEAAACFQRAVQLQPDCVEALKNLGAVRSDQGRLDDAAACYREALKFKPDDVDLHHSLGLVRFHDGRLEESVLSFQRALTLRPDFSDAHIGLGKARRRQGRVDEAVSRYRRALASSPDSAEALNELGIALTTLKSPDEADHCFRRALQSRPATASAQYGLGMQLLEVGDFDRAERCWREALRLDPDHAFALAELAKLRRGRLPAEDVAAVRRLVAAPNVTENQRSALHFGLAYVLDAHGDFAEAAEQLKHANSLRLIEHRARGRSYDPAEYDRFVAALMEQFSAAHFARVAEFGVETDRPVFVVGLPRSGTTLIEQVLSGHSQVFGAGELELARAVFEWLPQWTKSGLSSIESVGCLDWATISRIAREYLERLSALDDRARRIVDKMPENYLHLGLIATLFPRARLIHCRRDVRDVALSCWMADFQYVNWTNDCASIASRIGAYQRIMDHWRRVLPTPMLEVDYESTVVDLEGTARRLVEWCGLAWEPSCLAFHERRDPVRTASVMQVRQPVHQHSIGRWKNYAAPLADLLALLQLDGCENRQ